MDTLFGIPCNVFVDGWFYLNSFHQFKVQQYCLLGKIKFQAQIYIFLQMDLLNAYININHIYNIRDQKLVLGSLSYDCM